MKVSSGVKLLTMEQLSLRLDVRMSHITDLNFKLICDSVIL